jgi:ADP-heptose:LPS heptosyltransferase
MMSQRESQTIEAERLASEFLTGFQRESVYLDGHIARLAELALSDDEAAAKSASRAIFTSLIETLADSFDPAAVSLYNRSFSQIVARCRMDDRAEAIDRELKSFRIENERDMLARAERIRSSKPAVDVTRRVKMIVVLSRVTIGADAAITSVLIERLKHVFPDARLALVGGGNTAELFGGDARLSFHRIGYTRSGATLERLSNWIDVLKCVRSLIEGLDEDQYLIADPDSRLTQLGLLPLAADDRYLFFPSREYRHTSSLSLAELASLWLDEIFGPSTVLPRLALKPEDIDSGREVIKQLKRNDSRPAVTINFGVGENEAKRVGDSFEKCFVAELIRERAIVILDRGAGENELRRADAIIANAMSINPHLRVIELDEENLKSALDANLLTGADMLVWRGRIGLLAALIAESDLYAGYDSAGQHIAAAMGAPTIDVMAGYTSPRMIERWRPTGKGESRLIAIDTLNSPVDQQAALEEAMRQAREFLRK